MGVWGYGSMELLTEQLVFFPANPAQVGQAANGQRSTVNRHLSTLIRQPSTVNCQPSSVISQPSSVISQPSSVIDVTIVYL